MAVAAPAAYAPGILSSLGAPALCRLLVLVFCIAFTVENLQDLRDVGEDREAGVVTLPSALGPRAAALALLSAQLAGLLAHLGLSWAARLPLRPEMLLVYLSCGLSAACFREGTMRSLFQVALEPLYVVPLAA